MLKFKVSKSFVEEGLEKLRAAGATVTDSRVSMNGVTAAYEYDGV